MLRGADDDGEGALERANAWVRNTVCLVGVADESASDASSRRPSWPSSSEWVEVASSTTTAPAPSSSSSSSSSLPSRSSEPVVGVWSAAQFLSWKKISKSSG